MKTDPIGEWLRSTRIITRFCSQNGWIDDESLRYEVSSEWNGRLRVNVYFTEVVMDGAGGVAGRIECFGQLALQLDREGRVVGAEIV